MTPAPVGIDLKGLGLKGMFRPDGSPYVMLPEAINRLPSFYRTAATEVWTVLMKYVREWGELDERLITRKIAEELESKHGHRCEGFVYKGLHALQHLAKLITRVRKHGRRVIVFLAGLLGQKREEREPKGERPASPLSTPPPELREDLRDTTTRGGPSSCLGSIPERPGEARAVPPPELVARACKLIPGTTSAQVADAVAVYGADWVAWALGRVETRNRFAAKKGQLPAQTFGLVITILKGGHVPGEAPPVDRAAVPAPTPARRAPEKIEPVHQVTAEELAEWIGFARLPSGNWARTAIRTALRNGGVGPELVATIPPELLERE